MTVLGGSVRIRKIPIHCGTKQWENAQQRYSFGQNDKESDGDYGILKEKHGSYLSPPPNFSLAISANSEFLWIYLHAQFEEVIYVGQSNNIRDRFKNSLFRKLLKSQQKLKAEGGSSMKWPTEFIALLMSAGDKEIMAWILTRLTAQNVGIVLTNGKAKQD